VYEPESKVLVHTNDKLTRTGEQDVNGAESRSLVHTNKAPLAPQTSSSQLNSSKSSLRERAGRGSTRTILFRREPRLNDSNSPLRD
jgi:hypothetical protein